MRFSTFVFALAATVVGVQASNPIGKHCSTPAAEGCATDSKVNNGNAFIYECGPTGTNVFLAGCRCPTCCEVTSGGAFCT